jgi:hypothetical protein
MEAGNWTTLEVPLRITDVFFLSCNPVVRYTDGIARERTTIYCSITTPRKFQVLFGMAPRVTTLKITIVRSSYMYLFTNIDGFMSHGA